MVHPPHARLASRFAPGALAVTMTAVMTFAACGGLPADDTTTLDPSTVGCFVAYPAQFTDFRLWPSHHIDGASDLGGQTHVKGPRTEYMNALPDAGADAAPASATAFAQGTILVTEIESADPATHHVFAMVKRGCSFNADGAKGWEWFELSPGSIGGGKENILWRGINSPADKTYGDTGGGCNACHAVTCARNDSVCSSAFILDAGAIADGGLRD